MKKNSDMKELVVKANRLVDASYRLTLVEQYIVLLAIVLARETGKGLNSIDFVSISAKNYAEHFDADEKSAYAQIKEASSTLFNREFILYDKHPESGKDRVNRCRWVSTASYVDEAGVIQLRFSPDIVPYITRLETEFTRYDLEKVARMSSAYAVRLYELIMQWVSVGVWQIKIEQLKEILMIQTHYTLLKDFKKRVVDVAVSQINEHSDLIVSYTQKKTGRNVTHLIFHFKQKEESKPEKQKETKQKLAFDKSAATMQEKVEEFLKGNKRYLQRHSNIAPHILWRTPAIWMEFKDEFDEWLLL